MRKGIPSQICLITVHLTRTAFFFVIRKAKPIADESSLFRVRTSNHLGGFAFQGFYTLLYRLRKLA
jgi:hypothetical protein